MPDEPATPSPALYPISNPSPERYKQMEDIVLRICQYLGYDFNTVELAVRNGVPYAIDFYNPAPDADVNSVGRENFEWVVKQPPISPSKKRWNIKDGKEQPDLGRIHQTKFSKEKLY